MGSDPKTPTAPRIITGKLSSKRLPSLKFPTAFPEGKAFFFFLFINLLHGAQSQSMADYLQQVVYSFRGLRGQKPPS